MIYRKILTNKSLPLKKRMMMVFSYFWLKRSSRIQWKIRYNKTFLTNPHNKVALAKSVERAHRDYWKDFQSRVNMSTMRSCSNSSGVAEPKYIPAEVFRNDVEPTLNNTPSAAYLQYKSLYNKQFPGNIFPRDFFHNVNGEWLNGELESITFKEVRSMAGNLEYPVVVKPNKDTGGGAGISFPANSAELLKTIENRSNLVIQEKIVQHEFFNQFNPQGINSIRSNIYRSVKDNKLHVLNTILRMGTGGSLDNISDGGVSTLIRPDGYLNGYALDYNRNKVTKHPDTGLSFDLMIPDMEGLRELSRQVAHKLFYTRLVALDICMDKDGKWRVIEVNLFNGSPNLAQSHGVAFFGDFTDEVRDYCLSKHWTIS